MTALSDLFLVGRGFSTTTLRPGETGGAMSIRRNGILAGTIVLLGLAGIGPATAQYRGYDPDYAPRERYDRRYDDRRYDDRRGGYDRGYRGDDRRGYGGGGYDQRAAPGPAPGRRGDPMAGMSLDERKQAIRNHRDAQKKAIKRGYVIP
jgi:hypothetical protein